MVFKHYPKLTNLAQLPREKPGTATETRCEYGSYKPWSAGFGDSVASELFLTSMSNCADNNESSHFKGYAHGSMGG